MNPRTNLPNMNIKNMEKSTFVIDVDGTICNAPANPDGSYDYPNAVPMPRVIEKIQKLHGQGHTIILYTSRGMRTYKGDTEMIERFVAPVLKEWLERYQVPYHELRMGKPWGPNVYYIDDRAVSPYSFTYLDNYDAILSSNTLTL
jgi:capsule biosynthesis phosphatase